MTARQERFVAAFDGNATKAAIAGIFAEVGRQAGTSSPREK